VVFKWFYEQFTDFICQQFHPQFLRQCPNIVASKPCRVIVPGDIGIVVAVKIVIFWIAQDTADGIFVKCHFSSDLAMGLMTALTAVAASVSCAITLSGQVLAPVCHFFAVL